jgi:hypothetical protein
MLRLIEARLEQGAGPWTMADTLALLAWELLRPKHHAKLHLQTLLLRTGRLQVRGGHQM